MGMDSSRQEPKALRSNRLFSKACERAKDITHMGMMNRMRKKRMTLMIEWTEVSRMSQALIITLITI